MQKLSLRDILMSFSRGIECLTNQQTRFVFAHANRNMGMVALEERIDDFGLQVSGSAYIAPNAIAPIGGLGYYFSTERKLAH